MSYRSWALRRCASVYRSAGSFGAGDGRNASATPATPVQEGLVISTQEEERASHVNPRVAWEVRIRQESNDMEAMPETRARILTDFKPDTLERVLQEKQ
ncbi:hypothetical protein CMUS01_01342 [Colletotrichum musicola]|uniref:Uncharacterized protein n=1 Tax=Colletotrichum musicola TaxID=2175873 RepID=A0A8H6NX83_9PEZI|nr:hypothetical protein CMUS01_01342 [Colletotrichum musicola]